MNIIQIGCNNCNDHVLSFVHANESFIKKFVAIDALPNCVYAAKHIYSFLGDRLIATATAVGVKNGIIEFFIPKNDEMSSHASLIKSHLSNRMKYENVEKINAPCININDLLESLFKNEKIDYLFIDTEGFDVPILLELNLSKFKIGKIFYEYEHSTKEDQEKLVQKFQRNKYSFRIIDHSNAEAILA